MLEVKTNGIFYNGNCIMSRSYERVNKHGTGFSALTSSGNIEMIYIKGNTIYIDDGNGEIATLTI